MSTTAHTPGPWRLDVPEPDGEIIVMDEQDVSIDTIWKQPLDPSEWVEANARLIAAAPELLEALEAVQQITSEGNNLVDDDLAWIRSAIAKAKGGAA
jgi:hypothetical protein